MRYEHSSKYTQGRRIAQAALELCGSFERRDFVTFISSMSLNAELVACRTSTPWKSRQHKRRFGRSRDCDCFGRLQILQRKIMRHASGVILVGDLNWSGCLYRLDGVAMVALAQTENPLKSDTAMRRGGLRRTSRSCRSCWQAPVRSFRIR